MTRFPCTFLAAEVEFSADRERHVTQEHPDLLPAYRDALAATVLDPEEIRRSQRFPAALLFSRWYTGIRGGNHVLSWW